MPELLADLPGLLVKRHNNVGVISLNRPSKSNAFDETIWDGLPQAVRMLAARDDVRAVVLTGEGKNFTAGLDLAYLQSLFSAGVGATAPSCPARARQRLLRGIRRMQDAFTCLEELRWPVVAAVQGACVGAGVDLVTACDLRYCTGDAYFCVKEVDVAITADLGTLQRLPHIVGHGVAAELALTARRMSGAEAEARGLVTRCCASREDMMREVMGVAAALAAKPPLALTGTKQVLLHARDHSVREGLDHVALFNTAFLLSGDMEELLAAQAARRPPRYAKL